MSDTPPVNRSPTGDPAAGDGVELTVEEARGGRRSGRVIWILVISLAAAVVLLIGYWLIEAPHMQAVQAASGGGSGRALTNEAVSTFAAPEPAPRQTEPTPPSASNSSS